MHSGLVFEHLKECTQLAHERVMQCIQLEREEPMTVNEDTLSDYKSKFLTYYRALHRTHNSGSNSVIQSFINGAYDGSHHFNNAVSYLSQIGFPGLTRQDLLRLLKPDRDEEAMEIMAECRAYYQGTWIRDMRRSLLISVHVVAYKRFVDYVPMIIDYHLLKGFNRTIHDFLFKSLALGGEDARERCTTYLEEDPEIVNQRTTLSSMLNRMEIARVELLKVSCYYFFVTACELRAVHRPLRLQPQSLILPTIFAPSPLLPLLPVLPRMNILNHPGPIEVYEEVVREEIHWA